MGNEPYPLKSLHSYNVKRDFTSDRGFKDCHQFQKGQLFQYQKSTSNIHDMIEIVYFKDILTGETKIWNTRVENLHDNWKDYLEPLPSL